MKLSVALTDELHLSLSTHLGREDGQEDLCFAVWFPSKGTRRETAIIHTQILPQPGDRNVHGNAEFLPPYFERALAKALELGGGLAFLHSHPAYGWQNMSKPDVRAESGMAAAVLSATGFPLLGLTLAAKDNTWSARFWNRVGPHKYECDWVESIRVVGQKLEVSFNNKILPVPVFSSRQQRTVSAWGVKRQECISRLRVGIVGLGNVGGIVAEALARTGVRNFVLLDFDALEDINLDRSLLATPKDIGRAKVYVAKEKIEQMGVTQSVVVEACEYSVCEDEGYSKILDCDVIFSCVDRPWPRSILNFVAYAHLIPVIDGGIHVSRGHYGYRGADWKAHTATYGYACLRCLRQYDPAHVAAEQVGDLDDPVYIESLPEDSTLRRKQNVFAFGLALGSLEMLQFIMLTASPSGIGIPGAQAYHISTGQIDLTNTVCDSDCDIRDLVAKGDLAGHPGTGRHHAAEKARNLRNRTADRWHARIAKWIRRILTARQRSRFRTRT